ncbi:thiol-disulfide oxidoreductase DCC family protein [Candidatus Poriferisocius sp.]|uniref:thiol-disulfide oxidoreductase DCC family protein n=1 Tax=Candidatus Poriferisocius sp. TaxID=3101276 RepID=UPI003B023DDB
MGASPTPGETANPDASTPGETANPSASPTPGETANPGPSPPAPASDADQPHGYPGQAGAAGLLVYDGNCGFCTATAHWVERRLSGRNRIIPAQQADLEALGLTTEDVARSAWWIGPDGTRADEHLCIGEALRAMSGPWPLLGRLLTLKPISPLARPLYRLVARNRHRIKPRFLHGSRGNR